MIVAPPPLASAGVDTIKESRRIRRKDQSIMDRHGGEAVVEVLPAEPPHLRVRRHITSLPRINAA